MSPIIDIVLLPAVFICVIIFAISETRKTNKRSKRHPCIHTSIDCENCKNSSTCTFKENSNYLIGHKEE